MTQPEDHKAKAEPVTFEQGGKTWTLPPVKAGVLRKARKLVDQPLDLMFTALEAAAGDDVLAALDELDAAEVTDIFARWMATLGADLPQSSGSSI